MGVWFYGDNMAYAITEPGPYISASSKEGQIHLPGSAAGTEQARRGGGI